MALFTDADRTCAEALVALGYCNPFLPERIEYERVVLGEDFVGTDGAWHKHVEEEDVRPNIELLTHRAKALADGARERLAARKGPGEVERRFYEDTALYYLFNKYTQPFFDYVIDAEQGKAAHGVVAELYNRFQDDAVHYLGIPGATFALGETDHLFACFFQLRRAWHNIYDNIIGGSMASARLRAAAWQSIFTCDMRRYRRALYNRMGDITTLVTGPSGTGKELVARAIGLSRYIPFDPKTKRFATDVAQCFYPINLSALSPTLIESELFGHKKGAFTGAVADREGFLELCPADGAVFLDEIGELDPAIQVKLLRVLQTRVFQRIGDQTQRRFEGKVIAATNREPAKEMQEGRFRQDLYYRLCSDIIVTPSLREQIEGSPEQLHNLLLFLTRRVAGPDEAEALTEEVARWIQVHLAPGYAWPGNVRELEQCVRNVMIRKTYHPIKACASKPQEAFLDAGKAGHLTADDLLRRYCTLVYAETGSYLETARRLNLDRRTVKERVDRDLLAAFHNCGLYNEIVVN
ncbi:MAG: sigma-54 factor interaction domain-containing protein, partial [Candidatus Hydrogenedentes bacterium]|nr:sigma-54 factor interaction domain-containing protein [Candidatus Hydrogenedentota bacterium]